MFYGPEYSLCWWMFHASLVRVHVMLSWDRVFYKCHLDKGDWLCYSDQLYPYWFSASLSYQLRKRNVGVSNYNSGSVNFLFQFISFCLTYSDDLFLGTKMFTIILSSWRIGPLPWSLIILLVLKSVFFWNSFSHSGFYLIRASMCAFLHTFTLNFRINVGYS